MTLVTRLRMVLNRENGVAQLRQQVDELTTALEKSEEKGRALANQLAKSLKVNDALEAQLELLRQHIKNRARSR